MNSKRLLVTAALGMGLLLGSGVQAFARDRDDFNQSQRGNRNQDRREYWDRQDSRRDRDERESRSYREDYQAPAYNYTPNYYQAPAYNYNYGQQSRRPGFSAYFNFGSSR